MMEHDTEIFKRIQILRDMGIGLSVDDFGTGFSGLSRLVSLPVTEIKIDKSFVDRCLTEKRILALLEAITSIGQSLNLTVVAEGIETKEQFEMLQFFRVGSFFAFKTRVKSIRLLVQHAALSRYCSLPAFDIAFPVCLTFLMDCHCCSPVGLKRKL